MYRYVIKNTNIGIIAGLGKFYPFNKKNKTVDAEVGKVMAKFTGLHNPIAAENGETESWFTNHGNTHFKEGIRSLIVLYGKYGYQIEVVKDHYKNHIGRQILYTDRYQYIFKR